MNKDDLLSEVVLAFDGKWPSKDCIYMHEFLSKNTYGVNSYGDDAVCTRSDFYQRARELGYVNGYRWGVEYPTNGKKPDLADDVVVSFKETDGDWDANGGREVWKWNWGGASGFKITDQRYKPADTSYLDAPTVKDSLTDEWYDYDNQKAIGLPPVGVECLTWFDDGKECWQKCKVLALSPYEQDHMAVSLIGRYDRKLIWSQDFKPLDHNRKAEAEKKRVVDKLTHDVYLHAINNSEGISMRQSTGETLAASVIEYLYDAGYLKLPE